MMNKMKLGPILIACALITGACTSGDDVAAVAGSSAQQVELGTQDDAVTNDDSSFCGSIDLLVPFPPVIESADATEISNAAASYREVALLAPVESPNIVTWYFKYLPEVVELTRLGESDDEPSHDLLVRVALAGSIDPSDVERYVELTCPESNLSLETIVGFEQFVVLPADPLVPPSPGFLCSAGRSGRNAFGNGIGWFG